MLLHWDGYRLNRLNFGTHEMLLHWDGYCLNGLNYLVLVVFDASCINRLSTFSLEIARILYLGEGKLKIGELAISR